MPEISLSVLLGDMGPELRPGSFVFVHLPDDTPEGIDVLATVREQEGMSAVLARDDADRLGLEYDFVAAWITLRVDSALSAVGLTAAVSSRLAGEGISCNVIAGLHHDHLLVPIAQVDEAMEALEALSGAADSDPAPS